MIKKTSKGQYGRYTIEQLEKLPIDIEAMITQGHSKDEASKGIICNYKKISIVVKCDAGEIVGALQAYTCLLYTSPSPRD